MEEESVQPFKEATVSYVFQEALLASNVMEDNFKIPFIAPGWGRESAGESDGCGFKF